MARVFKPALLSAIFACSPMVLHAQAPVGELYSSVARVRGSVTLASGGTTILSGSTIESGEQAARLTLNRGGELMICQGTSVAVSASANGRDLMLSFGTGTIQSRYSIGAASDVIITPDFRFVATGPGEFDLDIGISPTGDTCVRSRRESTGGLIVNEQMGDATYQVKPSDFVVFKKGHVAGAEVNPGGVSCGCPIPKQTYVAKAVTPPKPAPVVPKKAAPAVVAENDAPAKLATPESLKTPLAQRIVEAGQQHTTVDAPFVFKADPAGPDYTARVMRLHTEVTGPIYTDLRPVVLPPPPKQRKKGFWGKFKSALFGS